jgi:hypothetical protein
MPRTTINIDVTVLRDLRRRQKREGKTLGDLISELLAERLASEEASHRNRRPFVWTARRMHARIDLEDKEALHATLDRE